MTDAITPSDFIFHDAKDGKWDLKISLATARRIDRSNFDEVTKVPFSFLNPSREFLGEIFSNVPLAMAVIWAIVQDQVEQVMKVKIVSDADAYSPDCPADQVSYADAETMFLERIDGNAIKSGKEALLKALADFFPDQRTVLLGLQKKFRRIEQRLQMELQQMDNQLDLMVDREIEKNLNEFREDFKRNVEDFKDSPGKTSLSPSAK